MKFKHINATTQEQYKRLISKYFTLSQCKYCNLVINKKLYPPPSTLDRFDVYINQLVMLIRNNLNSKDECIILPDNITIPVNKSYENTIVTKL